MSSYARPASREPTAVYREGVTIVRRFPMKKLVSLLVLLSVFMMGCGSDKKKEDKKDTKPAAEKKTDDAKK
jgi:hypothetical protein